jgi:hypothetical protein
MHRPGGGNVHRGNVHRGNVHRGNVNRNVHRGNVNRNVNGNVNRNVNRNINRGRPVVWAGRPGWYRWPAGGAIAAGAALGWLAAANAAWAGPPPQTGLCWYYTDPSRRQGFWDICP